LDFFQYPFVYGRGNGATGINNTNDAHGFHSSSAAAASSHSKVKVVLRRRDVPRRAASVPSLHWVQCSACTGQHVVPGGISPDSFPDTWTCQDLWVGANPVFCCKGVKVKIGQNGNSTNGKNSKSAKGGGKDTKGSAAGKGGKGDKGNKIASAGFGLVPVATAPSFPFDTLCGIPSSAHTGVTWSRAYNQWQVVLHDAQGTTHQLGVYVHVDRLFMNVKPALSVCKA